VKGCRLAHTAHTGNDDDTIIRQGGFYGRKNGAIDRFHDSILQKYIDFVK
jgi:hypothetical protein